MEDEKIREQYIAWAATYDEDKIKLFKRAGVDYQEFMTSFIQLCDLNPGMNILDVGVGTGLTSISIAKALSGNCKISAIEPVDAMIDRAKFNVKKKSLEKVISVEKGRGETIPSGDENYDLVTCMFAIRHMDVERALNEFKRVLKPTGKIVIADTCAPEKWRTFLGRILTFIIMRLLATKKKYRGEVKSKVLTVEEWKNSLQQLGLRIIQIKEFPGKKDSEWELKRVIISIRK